MTDKIILDVSIKYKDEEDLKTKAKQAKGTTSKVNPSPTPTEKAEQAKAEAPKYGGTTQLNSYILGRDGVYARQKKKRPPSFGVGWIQQEATNYTAEYYFCLGCKFTVWCGDGSKSLNFTIDNIYDTSKFGSELVLRAQSYRHDYCILPVKDDVYILWIYSTKAFSQYKLVDRHTLFLVSHTNIKQITKPADLEFISLSDADRTSGFFTYLFPHNNGYYTNYKETLYPQARRLYTQDRYTFDCGHSDGAGNYGGFGFYELGDYNDTFTTANIVGTGYIYNLLLDRPMGIDTAPVNSFSYVGMLTAPLRLRNYNKTSVWGNYPVCTETTLVRGAQYDFMTEEYDLPYFVKFTPDFAYGYAVSPPRPGPGAAMAFEMEAAVGFSEIDDAGSGGSSWWENFQYDYLYYTQDEMASITWNPIKFSLPVNTPLSNQSVTWGVSVYNEGFSEDITPNIQTRFWQMLSNPWGRDWTAELSELGFFEQQITF